jgi:hypothetical protein
MAPVVSASSPRLTASSAALERAHHVTSPADVRRISTAERACGYLNDRRRDWLAYPPVRHRLKDATQQLLRAISASTGKRLLRRCAGNSRPPINGWRCSGGPVATCRRTAIASTLLLIFFVLAQVPQQGRTAKSISRARTPLDFWGCRACLRPGLPLRPPLSDDRHGRFRRSH